MGKRRNLKIKNKSELNPSTKRGNRARQKGHNYERGLAKEFRDLGYLRCTTTRNSSRMLDACKVDLDIPDFNIQAKAVEANINYPILFGEIEGALKEHYPERLTYITAIFHKRGGNQLVILKKGDFYKLIKILLTSKEQQHVE